MLKIAEKDLIVRLDEQRDVLQLLVPNMTGESGELRVFYEISASEILNVDSLENHVGTTVLAFLSATYPAISFRLEEYRRAGTDFGQSMHDEATALLYSGDADGEFEGAMVRLDRFDETWSIDDIEGITALLEQAAKDGSEKADKFLRDDWPARSEILKKRLGRRCGS